MVSETDPVWGECLTLEYKRLPLRAVLIDGVPWFSLRDIRLALHYDPEAEAVIDHPDFPAHLWTIGEELPDPEVPGEPERTVLLSPVGVWRWTHFTDPARGQGIAAWTRREALARCPDADPKNPHVYLTMGPDWSLPIRPLRYSGRFAEWEELRFSKEYLRGPPRPIALYRHGQ